MEGRSLQRTRVPKRSLGAAVSVLQRFASPDLQGEGIAGNALALGGAW
jgi:hypothetical protein